MTSVRSGQLNPDGKHAHPERRYHSPKTLSDLGPYTVQGDWQFSGCTSLAQADAVEQTGRRIDRMYSSLEWGALPRPDCSEIGSRITRGSLSSGEERKRKIWRIEEMRSDRNVFRTVKAQG